MKAEYQTFVQVVNLKCKGYVGCNHASHICWNTSHLLSNKECRAWCCITMHLKNDQQPFTFPVLWAIQQWRFSCGYGNCSEAICRSQEECMLSQYIIIKQYCGHTTSQFQPSTIRFYVISSSCVQLWLTPLWWLFSTVVEDDWCFSMTRPLVYKRQLPSYFLPLNPGC